MRWPPTRRKESAHSWKSADRTGAASEAGSGQVVFGNLRVELLAGNSQQLRGCDLVAAGALQGARDQIALRVGEGPDRSAHGRPRCGAAVANFRRQIRQP